MNVNTSQSLIVNEQKCTVTGLYRIWIAFGVGVLFFAYSRNWIALLLWVVLVPLGKWTYIRFYPLISRLFGYEKTDDRLPENLTQAPVEVTYYSALGCPFCPIVLQRLHALQNEMGFKLVLVDVSFKPNFLASKGVRSVPVVEVDGRLMVGNATSEQLAELISLPHASLQAS
jgi:glutaredoxin